MKKILSVMFSLVLLTTCACGGSGTSETPQFVTAIITAGAGLEEFTFHDSTAYKANFTATGLILSGATSTFEAGHDITSYTWEQISGAAVTFTTGTTLETVTFDAPAITAILHASDEFGWRTLPISRNDAELIFRLTVADAAGNTSVATFTIYMFDDGVEIKNTIGLGNFGVGEKVYLSGPSLKATFAASITVTDWSWTLTPEAGSASTFTDTGLLTSVLQIPSFRPDVAGTYTVAYTSVSSGDAGTLTINASTYEGSGTIAGTIPDSGAGQCGTCHPTETTEWEETGHSTMFEQVISYYSSSAPRPYCWECHTVGYDTTAIGNDGMYDRVVAAGYSFPSDGTTWDLFVSDNPTLFPVTNIQCENCHGPGGAHLGTITDSKMLAEVWNAGVCGKCHPQEVEWKVSRHNSTGVVGNNGIYQILLWPGAGCARCHSSGGFVQEAAGAEVTAQNANDFLVGCSACHDPHSMAADPTSGSTSISGNDSTQLRLKGIVTMKDDAGTQIDADKAAVCYTCHDGFYVKGVVDCDSNGDGTANAACDTIDQVATQYFRQIHGNPQAFNLEGLGAVTAFSNSAYNFTLDENSFHSSTFFTLRNATGDSSLSDENEKCLTCHFGTPPTDEEEGYRMVGGHTFKLTNGTVEFLSTCTVCHPGLTTFNRPARADYDGSGTIGGVQDQIKGLLLALTNKILSIDTVNLTGGTTIDGEGVITVAALSYANQDAMNASPIDVRRAAYNHNLVARDGSIGVHNMAFAVQVLQKTYSAISQLNGGNSFPTDFPNAVIR
jgi:hypothetical protein